MKTCKACGDKYNKPPDQPPFQNWCSIDCGIELSRERQDKQRAKRQAKVAVSQRKAVRERREALKSTGDLAREAQTAFNTYIRARDAGKPCCSCDWPDDGRSQRHASHYRAVGPAKQLRYNTWNVHASCAQCNGMKSGNLIEYRIRLVKSIGNERVEWLETNNELANTSHDYLRRVKKIFNKRARQANARKTPG
jgi:hypothetical protein